MRKTTVLSLSVAGLLTLGAVLFVAWNTNAAIPDPQKRPGDYLRAAEEAAAPVSGTNVSTSDERQIIEIQARAGYYPRVTKARAGIPTTIRVVTRATFDCSSALAVPAVGFQKLLPASGATDIAIPAQTAGSRILGICSMGMYSFVVIFS